MKYLQVAIGVVRINKKVFLMRRQKKSLIIGDTWEFPGGKIEVDEFPRQTLIRELLEEINIKAISPQEIDITHYHYRRENCYITLHSFLVESWVGKILAREGQLSKWVNQDNLKTEKLPQANYSLIECLSSERI
jgi:8-oxo-dGTP diphosphatase